jgi:hypothetical protein
MIEGTVTTIEGVRFYSWEIVEPTEKLNGVPIEYVDPYLKDNIDVKIGLRALGLRKIDYDISKRADIYAKYPINVIRYKVIMFLLSIYWNTIHWLYDNARMFKQIPESSQFSWKYFTPYTWIRRRK